jgi:hypothetical protein
MAKIIKTVRIRHTVTIDSNTRRGVSYTGILDMNQIKKKLQDNFSIALASAFPMYKWFPQSLEHQVDGYYYEPPDDIPARKSATLDKSIGNLLLSHLPGWALWPDKETSPTVYSSRKTAGDFSKRSSDGNEHDPGRIYRVVPESGAKLVIAPTAHTRYAFQYALGQFGVAEGEYGSLAKFNGCFHELFHACGMTDGFPLDWQSFLTALDDLAFEKVRPGRNLSKDTEMVLEVLIKNKAHLLDFLDNAFSPLHNGFVMIDFNDGLIKKEYPDNEIWMAAPCLLIREEVFEEIRSV